MRGEIHGIGRCSPLKQFGDLGGGDLLRIEHHVDAHLREKVFVFVGEILLVVYARADFRTAQFLCEQGAHYVDILTGSRIDSDEQVGMAYAGAFKHFDR